MADEEFKVEVELVDESFWERLRTLDIDDEARERLGSRVTVTRDGDRIQLYTRTLADAGKEVEYYRYDRLQAEVKLDDADFDPKVLYGDK